MKVLVYGGGAVGLGISSCLIESGEDGKGLILPRSQRQPNLPGLCFFRMAGETGRFFAGTSHRKRWTSPRTRRTFISAISAAGFRTHWQTTAAYREVFYGSLIPVTRDHFPSTLQDIRAGKKTEIDAPFNRMAYSMVKFKETKSAAQV